MHYINTPLSFTYECTLLMQHFYTMHHFNAQMHDSRKNVTLKTNCTYRTSILSAGYVAIGGPTRSAICKLSFISVWALPECEGFESKHSNALGRHVMLAKGCINYTLYVFIVPPSWGILVCVNRSCSDNDRPQIPTLKAPSLSRGAFNQQMLKKIIKEKVKFKLTSLQWNKMPAYR